MSDRDCIETLVSLGSNDATLRAAQNEAAARLLAYDKEVYPKDGCAITMSILLQEAGIEVPDTFMAFDLARLLQDDRGWERIAIGDQQEGDIGTTCGPTPRHGTDHIFLVLHRVNDDEMVIADNQADGPHFRFVSGRSRSPTQYFLRARP